MNPLQKQLTAGAFQGIFTGSQVDSPVLQILSFKPIQSGGHQRYRLHLSDGTFSTGSSMLATHLNEIIDKEELTPFSLFRADRYVCNVVNQVKPVMIILDLTVLVPGGNVGEALGSPVPYDAPSHARSSQQSNHPGSAAGRVPLEPLASNQPPSRILNNQASGGNIAAKAAGFPIGTHPISSLTPYQNKWTICARVTNKSDIRTWSNSRGQGKLFSMDLLDESGEIRATAFNEQCDKFYTMVEVDKVYYITQAQLKTANKQYSSLKNDYEMTFNQGTQVTPSQESSAIPKMQFQFVTIDQLEKVEKDNTVDVIGVCRVAEEISTVTQKSTGKELKKRDIQLVDQTGSEIRLTLWGMQAEKFDGNHNPIVAVKGVKVSDFNGKSLSVLSSSALQINPDIVESHKLRAWYESVGNTLQTVNLSNQRSGNAGGTENLITLRDAILNNLGHGNQPDYYAAKGYVSLIRKENCLYSACPSDGCSKKVVDLGGNVYRCEKCSKEFDSFNWRLMLQLNMADTSGNVWVTAFQDQAERILESTAATVGLLKEQDENAFQNVINDAAFREFVFKLRVKSEVYNDEERLKTSVVAVQPVDPREYNRTLIQQICGMGGLNL